MTSAWSDADAIATWAFFVVQDLSLGACSLTGIHALRGLTGLTSLSFQPSLSFQEVGDHDGPLARMLQRLCHLRELEMIWQVRPDDDHLSTTRLLIATLPTHFSSANHLTKVVLGMYKSSRLALHCWPEHNLISVTSCYIGPSGALNRQVWGQSWDISPTSLCPPCPLKTH